MNIGKILNISNMLKRKYKLFREYNFHDSTIESMEISPSTSYGQEKANIVISLLDPQGQKIEIMFKDCKNISFSVDFDLLKDNSGFGNLSHADVKTNSKYLIKLIKKIEALSNIEYKNMASPVDKKIKRIEKYACFKIYFFGGLLEIIAINFNLKKVYKIS